MSRANKPGYHAGCFGSATLADRRAATKRRSNRLWMRQLRERDRRRREAFERRMEEEARRPRGFFLRILDFLASLLGR